MLLLVHVLLDFLLVVLLQSSGSVLMTGTEGWQVVCCGSSDEYIMMAEDAGSLPYTGLAPIEAAIRLALSGCINKTINIW